LPFDGKSLRSFYLKGGAILETHLLSNVPCNQNSKLSPDGSRLAVLTRSEVVIYAVPVK
jgi:hypothetical protein